MLLTNAEKLQHTTSSGSVWPEEEGGGGEEEEEEEENTRDMLVPDGSDKYFN